MTEALATYGEFRPISSYTDQEIRVYKRQLKCENCSADEWEMLKILSNMYALDPFARQIWLVPSVGVFVGHAGFLAIAHRSGKFDGMSTVIQWDAEHKNPVSATTTLWLKDCSHPVEMTVWFGEFNRPGTNGRKTNWDKMPAYMLQKVTEVHALKRAFSITGVYSPEEMGYDEVEPREASGYTASVDGEPVKVETITKEKPAEKKQEPKPARCTCGAEPMDTYERNKMQTAFDEQGLGTIPENLCKTCATKHWKFLKEQQQPTADPHNPYGMKPANGPAVPTKPRAADPEPEIIDYHGKLIKCVCKKCGARLNKNLVSARLIFNEDEFCCKKCDPVRGLDPA